MILFNARHSIVYANEHTNMYDSVMQLSVFWTQCGLLFILLFTATVLLFVFLFRWLHAWQRFVSRRFIVYNAILRVFFFSSMF
jgi:uncharacterized protein YqhQ